jgi:putative SOS response-associated peptidase YedK
MCGRYHHGPITERYWRELRLFSDELTHEAARYNIAPTTPAIVLRQDERGNRVLSELRWGLLPSWAKDKKMAYRMINARSETIREKPSFRSAFKRKRCFVLATGYYEWKKLGPKEKQTYDIRLTENRPLLFYGLWEAWRGPQDDPLPEPMQTFTIITTDSNDVTSHIHDRMPCIATFDSPAIDTWLDAAFEDYDHLHSLLEPLAADEVETVKVSSYVNKVGNEGEQCIEPI